MENTEIKNALNALELLVDAAYEVAAALKAAGNPAAKKTLMAADSLLLAFLAS